MTTKQIYKEYHKAKTQFEEGRASIKPDSDATEVLELADGRDSMNYD